MNQAARMLGVDADTIRRRIRPGSDYVEILGLRLRVYPMDIRSNAERRFDADEIARKLERLRKAK